MRDNLHNTNYAAVIPPVVVSDNTALVSPWLDRAAGPGSEALAFGVMTGTLADTDATFAVVIEDADAADKSDAAPVSDDWLLSQDNSVAPEAAASFDYSKDNFISKIGYIGHKRFVRIKITPSNNTAGAAIAAFAVRSRYHARPA